MKSLLFPCLSTVACLSLLTGSVWGQSATRGQVVQPGSTTRGGVMIQQQGSASRAGAAAQGSTTRSSKAPKTFEQKLWDFIIQGKYRNWAPVPGQSDKMYEGQSPHGAYLKMYLSRSAAGSPKDLPDKSIVIKENYGPDMRQLMAITVMFRAKGYNPQAGDWYWVKYLPNGRVDQKATPNGNVRLAGRVNGCIECHSGAAGGDYVFFNDEL